MSTAHLGAASVGANPISNNSDIAGAEAMATSHLFASRIPLMATPAMLSNLPNLGDDNDVGVEKEHVVPSDDERDLRFTGVLLASAASPDIRGQGRWREYRVYRTAAGNFVFSKIGRSVHSDERDKFETHVWKPTEISQVWDEATREYRPKVLTDALTSYFEFDYLAKQLYAKLEVDTSQRII
jgi:hypothetical protein